MFHDRGGGRVGKSHRHVCAIFQAIYCFWTRKYCFFFCILLLKFAHDMDEWITCKLKGWSHMLSNGISRYFGANFDFCFCVISSRDLFVCAIFYAFSNYGWRWRWLRWWMQNMKLQNANPVLSYFRSDQIGSGQNCMHTNAL